MDKLYFMHAALDILKLPTAPRYEEMVATFIRSWLSQHSIPFTEDRYGNLIARLRSSLSKKAVAFVTHMDHPGWELCKVSQKKLEGRFLGGVPKEFFRKGTAVEFFNERGLSIAQAQVQELIRWDKEERRFSLRKISGSVEVGTFGMWQLPVLKLNRSKTHLINRVCDDLAGCAAVLAMLEAFVKRPKKGNIYAIFTRREEIGLEGAFEVAASKKIPRSIPVISIETSKALSNAPQGYGPIIRVGDRTSIFDPSLTRALCETARELQKTDRTFIFQRKLMDGGTCEATAFSEAGYISSGLCIALGNYHNCGTNNRIMAENIHLDDWNGLVTLMKTVAIKLSG